MRKHYIDNLRWLTLLLLVPYHTAMAWNVWGEPNYIFFEGNRLISSIVVFLSPYFMPLLFVLAGTSTRLALEKRTIGQYFAERVKKLLLPFLFGTIALMPIMAYIADRFNYGYNGGFFGHYAVFFTKFTDLTGADGGFSFGQFWFLLYLLVISAVSVGVLSLLKKTEPAGSAKSVPFWAVLLLGLPLPLLSDILSIGGKSLAEYTYLFLLGYFVFSDDRIIAKAEKSCPVLLPLGLAASLLDVYLFIWSGRDYGVINDAAKYLSEWLMIIALLGFAKHCFNTSGRISDYMKTRSFLLYIYHFIWVAAAQYLLHKAVGNNTPVLFFGTVIIAYTMTFICCEISIRIPFLCTLTGTKHISKK